MNDERTVISISDKNEDLGRTEGLSKGDINKINNYYSCQNKDIGSKTTTNKLKMKDRNKEDDDENDNEEVKGLFIFS